MARLGGKKFGLAKSLWDSFSTFNRIDLVKCTNLRVSSFELGVSTGTKSRAVKGWIQLTNEQKRRIIDCLDDMGLLN